MFKRKVIRLW